MKTTVSFYTFGCRLNQAETAILQTGFEQAGYQVVDFHEFSEVVVVNTCTVTQKGDSDTRKIVNKINRKNPQAKIALVGCLAQIQRESLLELPNVKWVIGNEKKMELPELLNELSNNQESHVITPVISPKSFSIAVAGIDRHHTRANLKIQDGCDFYCSFCVIPFARGRARSREFENILEEAYVLVASGHRELVITGINVGTYHYKNKNIVDVLNALTNITYLHRLRISSIEPTTLPPDLIGLVKGEPKICRNLHIPLQSGSNDILSKMNRRYTVKEFSDSIWQIYENLPGVCLGTDVMVGFPGERESHFYQTYSVLKELPFAYFHVFSYSERPWTKSCHMDHKNTREVIENRSKILRELSVHKRAVFLEKQHDTWQDVLFEQKKKGYWSGLTDTYVRVKVNSRLELKNKILPVKMVATDGSSLIGKLL
jgi:threonylcarbamoyladenosine tRNA methylthiotransferase MtaB